MVSRKKKTSKRRTRGGTRPILIGTYELPAYKTPSEDRIAEPLLSKDNTVLALFDGHGGQEIVKKVNEELPKQIKAAIGKLQDPEKVAAILTAEFEKIDSELERTESGSTATVAVILSNHIVVANVGDSPALLFTKEGDLMGTTVNHDCYNPDEATRVIRNGGICIPDRSDHLRLRSGLAVTRSFGDFTHGKKIVIGTPQTYIWPRIKDTILGISSDSFAEEIITGISGKRRIESIHTSKDIMGELLISLRENNFNVVDAAKYAVEKRVARLFNQGDNTSLILAYL